MIAGLSIDNFTNLHVAISLVGIVSGLIVLAGMLRAQAARLDSIVSCHHHSYERDRLHVSDQWPHAGYRLWPDINRDIGDRAQCALCEAPGRGVEMDLRHDRVDRALSQRVRSDRAVVSEGAGVAKTGTDAVRAAVLGHSGRTSGGVPYSRNYGRAEISSNLVNIFCGSQAR